MSQPSSNIEQALNKGDSELEQAKATITLLNNRYESLREEHLKLEKILNARLPEQEKRHQDFVAKLKHDHAIKIQNFKMTMEQSAEKDMAEFQHQLSDHQETIESLSAKLNKFRDFRDQLATYFNEYSTPQTTPFKNRSVASLAAGTTTAAAIESTAHSNGLCDAVEPHTPIDNNHSETPCSPTPSKDRKETVESRILNKAAELKRNIPVWLALNEELNTDLEAVKAEKQELEEKIKLLESQISSIEKEFQAKLHAAKERSNKREETIKSTLEREKEELAHQLKNLSEKMATQDKDMHSRNAELESTLQKSKEMLDDTKQQLHQKDKEIQEKATTILNLRREVIGKDELIDKERVKNSSENASLKKKFRRASLDLDTLTSSKASDVKQLQDKIESLERRNSELTTEIEHIERRNSIKNEQENNFRIQTARSHQAEIAELNRAKQDLESALASQKRSFDEKFNNLILLQRKELNDATSESSQSTKLVLQTTITRLTADFDNVLKAEREKQVNHNAALMRENDELRRELAFLRRESAGIKSAARNAANAGASEKVPTSVGSVQAPQYQNGIANPPPALPMVLPVQQQVQAPTQNNVVVSPPAVLFQPPIQDQSTILPVRFAVRHG